MEEVGRTVLEQRERERMEEERACIRAPGSGAERKDSEENRGGRRKKGLEKKLGKW